VLPTDLQTYGLIPELLGRIPIITALHPLSQSQLVSILTEPRNSLVRQYTTLFNTYGIQLRFTTPALHAIAARALSASNPSPSASVSKSSGSSTPSGIGARGLRSILESVLGEIMFWGPGSGIRFCLVDEAFVKSHYDSQPSTSSSSHLESGAGSVDRTYDEARDKAEKGLPPCWSRGQARLFEEAFEKEEEVWRRRESGGRDGGAIQEDVRSFEMYREVGRSGM
jgi:ATP-dependent Clp protease ATP-binding subunit ClpX